MIQYVQLTDPDDIAERWSSMRNQSFLLTWLLSPQEKEEFLDTLISDFVGSTYQDISEMTEHGSGFIFDYIIKFDVRTLTRDPGNLYYHHLGSDSRRKFQVHPVIKPLFNKTILDSKWFLRNGHDRDNLCIPGSILLVLHSRLGFPIRTLNIQKMEKELGSLNYKPLLRPDCVGIALDQLDTLEKLNTTNRNPQLKRLFPALSFFQGLAISTYVLKRKDNQFRLFPVSISKNARNQNFFNVDLLIGNQDITPSNKESKFGMRNHVFAITNLAHLVCKLTGKSSNVARYEHVCHTCFTLLENSAKKEEHFGNCTHTSRGVLGRRKSKNRLLHTPFVFNNYLGKAVRNGLYFKRGSNYKRLKPLVLGALDFETYGSKLTPEPHSEESVFGKRPSSAVSLHVPASYAYCFHSLYDNIKLPSYLSNVRIRFFDDCSSEATVKDFYLSLLLNLRKDMVYLSQFLRETLDKKLPTPTSKQRSPQERAYIRSRMYCDICGVR